MPKSDLTLQTILFADIADSTRLYESLGDSHALALVSACLEKINAMATSHQGRVVKTIGDEIMCVFDDPNEAMSAAVAMHETIYADPRFSDARIRLRIGLHHGPAICEDGDYYGDTVNTAARMVTLAKAGQVITNQPTLNRMNLSTRDNARLLDQTLVRGKHQIINVYEIAWGQPEELTLVSKRVDDLIRSSNTRTARMTIEFADQAFEISRIQPMVSMGRDTTNHLVVDDPNASRLHARIEIRRDKIILVDQSTNGTFVQPDNGKMIILRRDETSLSANGYLSLGRPVSLASPHIIRFSTE
jgi:class 3 adenylate cyclase